MVQRHLWGNDGLPPHQDTDTSIDAAKSMVPHTGRLQAMVLNYITEKGAHGATDEEIWIALRMEKNSINPRRIELEKMGLIIRTDERRFNRSGRKAIVFKLKKYGV